MKTHEDSFCYESNTNIISPSIIGLSPSVLRPPSPNPLAEYDYINKIEIGLTGTKNPLKNERAASPTEYVQNKQILKEFYLEQQAQSEFKQKGSMPTRKRNTPAAASASQRRFNRSKSRAKQDIGINFGLTTQLEKQIATTRSKSNLKAKNSRGFNNDIDTLVGPSKPMSSKNLIRN